MGGKLSIGETLREVATNYWRHAPLLLPPGFAVALLAALIIEVGTGLWGTIAFLVLTPALWTLYEGVGIALLILAPVEGLGAAALYYRLLAIERGPQPLPPVPSPAA